MPGGDVETDERALVAGLQSRAEWARREFLLRAHDAVYGYACRLSRDVDLRRDWTHDCLLRLAHEVADGRFVYRHPGSFWAWFRVRAPYIVLDSLRARRRLELREQPGPGGDGDEERRDRLDPAGPDDPSLDLERLEILEAVDACLAALANLDQRQALALLLYQELSYQEIADTLDRTINTVRTDIRRGRLALRECLVRRLALEP